MPRNEPLTSAYVRERFNYVPETGALIWRKHRVSTRIGQLVGALHIEGYRVAGLDGKQYRVHRLIWLYVHGEWPKGEIDHINGDPADNRICNLRDATRQEQMRNRPRSRNNSSGFKGVYRNRSGFVAHIDGRHFGYFKTAEAAHIARCAEVVRRHGEFANVGRHFGLVKRRPGRISA